MTYEEKLNKVVFKLREERELTREGRKTKVTFDDTSFTKIRIADTCKILLKLQDDEGAVKILEAIQPIETVSTEQIISPSDDDDYEAVEGKIAKLKRPSANLDQQKIDTIISFLKDLTKLYKAFNKQEKNNS